MTKQLRWAAALAVLVAAPGAAQENPAALVMRVSGDVQVLHEGSGAAAAVGARLVPGDEVVPASGARAILLMRTGASQVVTSTTTVSEPRGGGNPDLFARAIRTLAQAASSDARTTGGRQGMIRPIPGEPVLVAPRNELTVSTTRPTFSWMAVDGAKGYTIQIRDVDGGKPTRFQSKDNTWTLPEDAEALTPGATYAWTVAPLGGRATMEQRFRVMGQDERHELDTTIGQISDMGLDPKGDGLFLTAMVYRDLGLFYDAADALDGLDANGAMTADMYLLKGEILTALGHAEEARTAFDKADAMMR